MIFPFFSEIVDLESISHGPTNLSGELVYVFLLKLDSLLFSVLLSTIEFTFTRTAALIILFMGMK